MPDAPLPESLFMQWLADEELGEACGIDELCRQHPQCADEVRDLHRQWTRLAELQKRAGLAGSLAERLHNVHGSDVDPKVELEHEESGDFTETVLSRLSGRTSASGRYHLKGEVGHGGMGAVLRVWDEDLRRHLAMKVLLGKGEPRPSGDTPDVDKRQLARFLEEAQVTGQLDHPGIVPVHELGLDADGRVFFTMKLVKGKTLAQVFEELHRGEGEWTQTRVLGLILRVCEAMSYAHAKGVLHRDLKPANVMVGSFGEVYVMDWGLAKIVGREDERDIRIRPQAAQDPVLSDRREQAGSSSDSPLYTVDGDVVGTPAYMPPEQANGRIAEMAPASDVYAIGAMLYHLLAREMPYVPRGEHVAPRDILKRLLQGPPRPLHALSAETPAELVSICEKSMARAPGDRYADMQALAADLAAFVEGRVVGAYETGSWAETRKWVQRNKGLAGSLAAAIVLLVTGLVSAMLLRQQAMRSFQLAEDRRRMAEENEDLAVAAAAREKARVDDVFRLSALQDLEDLLADAEDLWPPHPENVEPYREWIGRGTALVAELPRHRAKRDELRALALPRSEEQRRKERESHPEFGRLDELQGEIEAKRRAFLQRRSGATAELPTVDWNDYVQDAAWLNAVAWPLVDPARTSFGSEPLGLVLSQHALELSDHDAELAAMAGDTLAWSLFALGRDEAAHEASAAALAKAPESRRREFAGYLSKIDQAIESARSEEALELAASSLATLEADLAALEARVDERRDWRFPPHRDNARWWHTQLTKLIDELAALIARDSGLLAPEGVVAGLGWSVPKRLEFAERLQLGFAEGGEYAKRWDAALPAIDAAYPMLALAPQMGLVPIGPDPDSGLWEFWHVATGIEPKRAADRSLVLTEKTGVVLVLIPGGTFWMGAQSTRPRGQNYDQHAEVNEGPVHEVELPAFLLSKFELTEAQWKRITGGRPSEQGPDIGTWPAWRFGGPPANPINRVSWLDCVTWLPRVGLAVPSEAQWERGCRGETDSVWWSGSEKESLAGVANLADEHLRENNGPTGLAYETWLDDGSTLHAPIGTYAANAFGLHEMHGNISEWCLDGYFPGYYARSPDKAPLAPHVVAKWRVARGGSYYNAAENARSADRSILSPWDASPLVGIRPAKDVME